MADLSVTDVAAAQQSGLDRLLGGITKIANTALPIYSAVTGPKTPAPTPVQQEQVQAVQQAQDRGTTLTTRTMLLIGGGVALVVGFVVWIGKGGR